jgi:hypothetical protein
MNDFGGSRPTGIDWQGSGHGMVRFGEDSRLVVIFYVRSVRNEIKSKEIGAPYHDNVTFVRIHEPGERLNVVDRPMQSADKARFPLQWSKFLQNKEQIPEGTPIELLFPNNAALAENLKAQGVYTIQQCAKLSSNAIDNIGMGAQEYVNAANKYLESATSGIEFHKMREELARKDQDHRVLELKFNTLQGQFNALLERLKDPAANSTNPPWIPNHDAPAERIDLNHPSRELAAAEQSKKRKRMPPPSPVSIDE